MIEDALRSFITDELGAVAPSPLSDDYPLIERNVLDSIGLLHVVAFVESEFGVGIPNEELDAAHFGSISAIAGLVESKLDA